MRCDRAASLYLFRPIARMLPRRRGSVPILMYHRIPEVDQCDTHPYYCTSTATPVFEEQIRCLRQNGYRAVSITEAYRAAQTEAVNEKLVAITFDDGYQDFYTNAFPVLQRYGFSTTVF